MVLPQQLYANCINWFSLLIFRKKTIFFFILKPTICVIFIGGTFSAKIQAQYWHTTHYSVENGLPDNYIYGFEMQNDSLLIATDGGIASFDGKNFTPWHREQLKSPVVVFKPNLKDLVVCSWQDGLLIQKKEGFTKLSDLRINKVIASSKTHLFYNSYRKDYFLNINPNRELDTVIKLKNEDSHRLVALDTAHIIISHQNALHFYDFNGKILFQRQENLLEKSEILAAINNQLFFGGKDGVLRWYDKEDFKSTYSYLIDPQKSITKIKNYSKQQLLIQTSDHNENNNLYVLTFNTSFKKVIKAEKIFSVKNGISDLFVVNQLIYIALYGDGFFKIQPAFIKSFNKEDTKLPIPKFIFENSDEQLVFSTENTFYTLKDDGTFKTKNIPVRISAIFNNQNKLFYSSFNKLYDERFTKIADVRVTDLLKSSSDELLYYSKYYFGRIQKDKRPEELFCVDHQDEHKKINTGLYENGSVFLGTENGIVFLTKNRNHNWLETAHILSEKFNGKTVNKILKFKNGLLIATPYELYTYSKNELSVFKFKTEPLQINTVFLDHENDLFIGTDKGLWVYLKNHFYQFTKENGSNSNFIYHFFEDSNHTIWIISGNGIMQLLKRCIATSKPPKIQLHPPEKNENEVAITFKSIQHLYPKASRFEYQLNKSEWKPISSKRVELYNLKPGNYKFSVRGKSVNSVWSSEKSVSFVILPKWFQTWWFRISIMIFLLSFTTFLFLKQLSIAKKRNQTLTNEMDQRILLEQKVQRLQEEVARDFHDEIGNKIASMIGLSSLLKGKSNIESQRIEKITLLSKDIYETAKDFIWSLSPKNNNLNSLCKYLRDYGENFFDLFSDIDFLYYESSLESFDISYKKSRHLILAYKEILSNVVRHAQATKVVLKIDQDQELLLITIQDNGIGFNENDINFGNGLLNIKTRIKLMNASLTLNSSQGVTYKIRLSVDAIN
ncbi:ATP-binding protein [Ascidiimonas sp. W6]|uniref:sensor histidine kinase n=1 Tax=Ascidiimonas meishanensis TaxID=3128903 RepID=UPI0030EB9C91